MTTMHSGGFGDFSHDQMPVEQRTSVLAILALILSLLGLCVPGFGLLGLIFGIVAMVLISGSNGRLSGRGLAAAGIVFGLFVTVIWTAVFVGAKKIADVFGTQIVAPADATMKAMESGDWKTARAGLVSSTADKLTDADFEAFRSAYQDKMGSYQAAPTGFLDFLGQISEMGPAMSKFQNNNSGLIPIPMTFSKGKAVIALQINPQGGRATTSNNAVPITNIQLMMRDGTTVTLYDPDNRSLPAGDGAKSEPSKPEAPASEAPKAEPAKDAAPK